MRLTSAGVVLVLLAVAGCGGGSDDSFTKDYNRAVRPLSGLSSDLGTTAAEFKRLADRTRQTRENLAGLDPPRDAQDEMDRLLARLDEVTRDLSAVARGVRSRDPVRQKRAAERLVKSSAEVQRAETALHQAVAG
jgi:hypothetical protein